MAIGPLPVALADATDSQLNFKIYNPDASATGKSSNSGDSDAKETAPDDAKAGSTQTDSILAEPAAAGAGEGLSQTEGAKVIETTTDDAAGKAKPTASVAADKAAADAAGKSADNASLQAETPKEEAASASTDKADTAAADKDQATASATPKADEAAADSSQAAAAGEKSSKVLQGYVRVVPSGTKIPIIMDTAVDSDTSQEGDEFSARTAEDLNIDGAIVVPAGSIIKGRIAQLNAPRHMNRCGSVALKFDTVTTPDNRQIPLVANLVAHGGVVHARRGLKDIAIDSGTVALPLLIGLGIGALAGNSNNNNSSSSGTSSSNNINKGEAAMIGAGVGLVVGVAILCAKRGKKVDVRAGDELKIELAEDLHMPVM